MRKLTLAILPLLLMCNTGFTQELDYFRENYKFGFKDASGKIVIPAIYDDASSFREGLAKVATKGKHGYINKDGKIVIPLQFNFADDFQEGMAKVGLYNEDHFTRWGYIDKTGKIIIPVKYEGGSRFINGQALVRLNDKERIIDKTGKVLTNEKYDGASLFSEGMGLVYKGTGANMKVGFVDPGGKEIVPLIYKDARDFIEGLAAVKQNEKWGFIDKTGKLVIPLKYDYVRTFKQELAAVKLNQQWGFIDKTGKTVIPLKYDDANSFTSKGLAPVSLNKKWGLINKQDDLVTEMIYNEIAAINLSFEDRPAKKTISSVQNSNTQTSSTTTARPSSSEKKLTNVFSKKFNLSRTWLEGKSSSLKPTDGNRVGLITFSVNANEIKVYTNDQTLEDTHTILSSKLARIDPIGNGKLYNTKSKKHNTIGEFFFADDEATNGLVIKWEKTYIQYLFLK